MTTSPTLETIEAAHGVDFTLRYEMHEIVGSADHGYYPDLLTWTVTLQATRYDEEGAVASNDSVATMVLHSVDTDPDNHRESFFSIDSYSHDMLQLAEATMSKWGWAHRIIAVESVELDKKYRGQGIAPIILTKALHRIGGGSFAAILKASPLKQEEMSTEEIAAAEKALGDLWKLAGFTKTTGAYRYLDGDKLSVEGTERKVQTYLRKKNKAAV